MADSSTIPTNPGANPLPGRELLAEIHPFVQETELLRFLNLGLDVVGGRGDLQFSNLVLARKFPKIPPFLMGKKLVD